MSGQLRVGAELSRADFVDPSRAAGLMAAPELGLWDLSIDAPAGPQAAEVVLRLGHTGHPDLAVLTLLRLAEAQSRPAVLRDAMLTRPRLRDRLLAVIGSSQALGDHLVANRHLWQRLDAGPAEGRRDLVELRRGLRTAMQTVTGQAEAVLVRTLRAAYREALVDLVARDLSGVTDTELVAAELSDLAAATLDTALDIAAGAAPVDAAQCRLAVIGLGKCGGGELNYVSDVDVVFVAEPAADVDEQTALRSATRLATEMMRLCALVAWPVDAALRPEGKSGALVRTLTGHETYYRRWARTWEFQALLKMRPVAGDAALGHDYVRVLWPLVWSAAERENFVADVQQMRRRVEDTLPAALASRELKLGPGGLRDVEFAVQLLQLVHGRADETLRSPTTLTALRALATGGYVGRSDAVTFAAAYRFLREAEHRLQLQRLRRTHLLPEDADDRRWLARSLGFAAEGGHSALDRFDAEHQRHAREVRRLHEKLFYRPLLSAVARVPGDELRMSQEAALGRLAALGFADPEGALRHLDRLTAGVSRTAALQRLLLPAMLRVLADCPAPDAGLLAYRQVSDHLGSSPWYLRLLRDEGQAAERLATLLGTSRYVADLLGRAPDALRLLADDDALVPQQAEDMIRLMRATIARHPEPAAAVLAVRDQRRRELIRIAAADLLEQCDVEQVGQGLSDVAAATIRAALDVAVRKVTHDRGAVPTRIAVIAMGRLGSQELGYGSDADVLFVHDPLSGACEREAGDAATAVAEQLRDLLGAPAPDPPLLIDAGLRPEGRNGPLTRTLASYGEYYARWASVWEAQALLRATPIAGDVALGREFITLVDPIRYPVGGIPLEAAVEIRRIKARVDAERLPRGADPATHTKLGRGGLGDVEWTVQLLQLQHAAEIPELRTPSTLRALRAAGAAGLIDRDQAAAMEAAWRFATRCRNAIMLVRGRAGDQLPRSGRDLAGVARALGYPPGGDAGVLLDDYRRAARRARGVVEKVFYG